MEYENKATTTATIKEVERKKIQASNTHSLAAHSHRDNRNVFQVQ